MGGVRVAEEVVHARAFLSRVAEPANVAVWALVREVGPVEAAERIRSGAVTEDVATATSARRSRVDPAADLDAAERHGIRLVMPESADWPHFGLAALEHTGMQRLRDPRGRRERSGELVAPLALWVKGDGELSGLGARSVGLVGSRAATGYGAHVTSELAFGLAGRGVEVVSGGAYGIDASAHRAALAAGGSTVIVSAGGLDRPYPAGNAELFERVAAHGLLLSESPPGCAPQRQRFLTRNRVIAALSTGVVVVEAARRSGALNTAGHARAIGRPLMAVPGPVTSTMSAGCHDLLRFEDRPAVLVDSVEHVLAVIGSAGEGIALDAPDGPADAVRLALDRMDPSSRRVFDAIPARGAVSADRLSALAGVELRSVLTSLPALQLAGLVDSGVEGLSISAAVRRALRRETSR